AFLRTQRRWRATLTLVVASLIGVVGATAALFTEVTLRDRAAFVSLPELVLFNAVALGIWGVGLGVAAGVFGSRADLARAGVGRLVGGVPGAVAYSAVYPVAIDVIPFDDPICLSCVLQYLILGAGVGFGLGFVDIRVPQPQPAVAPSAEDRERPAAVPPV